MDYRPARCVIPFDTGVELPVYIANVHPDGLRHGCYLWLALRSDARIFEFATKLRLPITSTFLA